MTVLYLHPLPKQTQKRLLFQWIADQSDLKPGDMGRIEINGNQAKVEIPDSISRKIAKKLNGCRLRNNIIEAWVDQDTSGYAHDAYFRRLLHLLKIEMEASTLQMEEGDQMAKKTTSTCLTGLVVTTEDTGIGGHLVLTLAHKNRAQSLPRTRLNVGSPVLLIKDQPPTKWRGILCELDKNFIRIAMSIFRLDNVGEQTFSVRLADDEVSYIRERMALIRVRNATGNRLAKLRDCILGTTLCSPQVGMSFVPLSKKLNPAQYEAVRLALSVKDIGMIHGPPGTGKTTTVIELIRQAIQRGQKVLACAPSNLAVDNIFERLLDAGEHVIRLGHPVRIRPQLRTHTLENLVEKDRDYRQAKHLWKEANKLLTKWEKRSDSRLSQKMLKNHGLEARSLTHEAERIECQIVQSIIDSANVICSTLHGVDGSILGTRSFDLLVIDEACQCTEPAAWIPIVRCDRVILAGDHCQLPPTVISKEAMKNGYYLSLFEQLMKKFSGMLSRQLTHQYRMNEHIMAFSSTEFYQNSLVADPSVSKRLLTDLKGIEKEELTTTPVQFIDTSGSSFEEEKEKWGSSYRNFQEAQLVCRKVDQLLNLGVMPGQLAVVTPYSAQVRCIQESITDSTIEVTSIDGYQGRENDVIIISLVRSNSEKTIGFLNDTRRMNVALTRARRKLIVIGDSSTIITHPFYERLLDYFDKIEAYSGVWDEEW